MLRDICYVVIAALIVDVSNFYVQFSSLLGVLIFLLYLALSILVSVSNEEDILLTISGTGLTRNILLKNQQKL